MRVVASILSIALLGCPSETKKETESQEEAPKKKVKKPAASASAAPKAPERQDLSPLPLTIELPAEAKIVEKSEKSAMIEIGGVRMVVSTNSFADQKNTVKSFPFDTFAKWVRDEKNAATAEMGTGTPNYRALEEFEVGGKKYVCSNVGTKGMASAEEAEKMVARCKTLQPKS